MSDKKTVGAVFAPFNIIAMKDIKDKKSQKPGLRPLFDCIDSIQAAVEDIRLYLEGGTEQKEADLVQGFLKQLTDMQIQLLEVTKSRVQEQNLSPVVSQGQSAVEKATPVDLAQGVDVKAPAATTTIAE